MLIAGNIWSRNISDEMLSDSFKRRFPCHPSTRYLDCICSTCLSIFPEASSGRAPHGGRCVPIWVDRISPSFLRPRLLHLEEATPGEPESSSIVSRWLLDAWEICEQLFRRGLLALRNSVTSRHVFTCRLLGQTRRMKTRAMKEREREEGARAHVN